MKTRRIFFNILEFLFLSIMAIIAVFQLLWSFKHVASHDFIYFLYLIYAGFFLCFVNLLLQSVILFNTKKTGTDYYFAKFKIFSILLVIGIAYGSFLFERLTIMLHVSAFLFIPYLLFFLFYAYFNYNRKT